MSRACCIGGCTRSQPWPGSTLRRGLDCERGARRAGPFLFRLLFPCSEWQPGLARQDMRIMGAAYPRLPPIISGRRLGRDSVGWIDGQGNAGLPAYPDRCWPACSRRNGAACGYAPQTESPPPRQSAQPCADSQPRLEVPGALRRTRRRFEASHA
jgi:hypothetical protein